MGTNRLSEANTLNLELTDEQVLLQKTVRDFAESEVRPHAKEHDETGHFPRALFKKAAELGLTGVAFPESEGGAGFDHVAYTIVIEEISRCCASTGVILSVQNSLYCDPIHRFGTEEQKKKFLLPYTRGEKMDHQRRRGGRRDRLCKHRSAQGREGYHRARGGTRDGGLQGRQRRKKAGHQRHRMQRTRVHRLRSAGGEPHRK
jgi:hypothetical protein